MPWRFVSPADMAAAFAVHPLGKAAAQELSVAPERTETGKPLMLTTPKCMSCTLQHKAQDH
jgi:hypothetical protein